MIVEGPSCGTFRHLPKKLGTWGEKGFFFRTPARDAGNMPEDGIPALPILLFQDGQKKMRNLLR